MNTTLTQTINRSVLTFLHHLDKAGSALGPLALRLLLAVEFGASGWEKFHGENWFADIQDQFPFPFNIVPPNISWGLSTYIELLGAAALVIGLGTRAVSVSLVVLTWVAIAAVHWPHDWHTLADLAQGYVISDDGHGNYKLPLMYLVMFVPLLFRGPGVLSADHWIRAKATQAVDLPKQ